MTGKQRAMSPMIKGLVLSTFFLFGGFHGTGWASNPEIPLQVEGDRLTGNLPHVTLGAVLKQLQQQLGIDYEVPAEELDTVISVDLQQVPILPALARILAPWDYAFTVNAAGQLQFLYVTPKAPLADADREGRELSDGMPSNVVEESENRSRNRGQLEQSGGGAGLSLPHERGPAPTRSPSRSPGESSPQEPRRPSAPVAVTPMPVQPVPDGAMMPIAPATGGAGMQVTPQANTPDMPIIPSTAYPPMDVQPVPEYMQQEMLRNMQP
jgi:hypothetical protein